MNSMDNAVTLTIKGSENREFGGELRIRPGAQMIVQAYSTFNIENNGRIHFISSSDPNIALPKITMKSGSRLCNKGYFSGKGLFRVEKGVQYCIPDPPSDFIIEDSVQFILNDSAEYRIPSNSNIIIEGNETRIVMGSNSKLLFGQNSKLILRNGARLIANNATFTYLDSSNKSWDGIYLYDKASDTLINCTIENAVNGINIINRTDPYSTGGYSAIISGCSFINTGTTALNHAINAENSANLLLKDNTISGTTAGYSNGIVLSYCPALNVNIINNTIGSTVTGITSTGSSAYIFGNTITGTQSGYGLYLDNSSGSIKYNNITGFNTSAYIRSSSPYLFSNTFTGAASKSIELRLNSVTVLSPVISDNMLYYMGGANTFSSDNPHLTFDTDAYPMLEKGINNFSLTQGYYMTGEIPSSLPTSTLNAEYNYWSGDPEPGMFSIINGTLDYEPWNNQAELPQTDGYDLSSIGFGLYDTVYYDDLSYNPTAGDIFIQAYRKEIAGQYSEALNLYKQVIQNYRYKPIAPAALLRIFSVLEKRISNYQEYETYYNNIKNNSQLTRQIRDMAEDLIIRTKVRRNMLDNAINDYTAIYNQNPNSIKGQHALHNRDILIAMRDSSNMQNISQNPQLTGNNINNEPISFKLYQNYPNPFNPSTMIKYYIPKEGMISIKVYDISGREILNTEIYRTQGEYEYIFDGSKLSSGVYFYQLEYEGKVYTKKMILMK